MKHIAIAEYGTFLGLRGERLILKNERDVIKELPLNRLSTICVLKNGVSFSSDLMLACGARGIKFFIFDEYAREVVCLAGGQLHAVAKLRDAQFSFNKTEKKLLLSKTIIVGKIKNQKAVLSYFRKYISKKEDGFSQKALYEIEKAILTIQNILINLNNYQPSLKSGIPPLLGYEGAASQAYFSALIESKFFPSSFKKREGRGANDIVNQMLNYGYGILSTYIWHCLINSGLEVYEGFLHSQRAGKPSLVLDMMEEFRPWVIDRTLIKLRDYVSNHEAFTKKLRILFVNEIQSTIDKKFLYKGSKLRLESIMQRQMYRLCGEFYGTKTYKPYIFKW